MIATENGLRNAEAIENRVEAACKNFVHAVKFLLNWKCGNPA